MFGFRLWLRFSRVRLRCDDVIVLTKHGPKFVIGYAWFQDGGLQKVTSFVHYFVKTWWNNCSYNSILALTSKFYFATIWITSYILRNVDDCTEAYSCQHKNTFSSQLSRTYEIISRTYEIISRTYEIISRTYEIISRTYEIISRTYEIISRTYGEEGQHGRLDKICEVEFHSI